MNFKVFTAVAVSATSIITLAFFAKVYAQPVTKVACVGNSITEGFGLNWDDKKYPENLQTYLNQNAIYENQFQVSNFGHSGRMFRKNSAEPYWISEKFTAAYNFAADIVVIELGTNDSKYYFDGKENYLYTKMNRDEMLHDYEALIDTFAHQAQAPKIFTTLQPYADNLGWYITDTAIVNQINPIIKEAAIKKGVNLIDLHALFNNKEWLLADNVHPNALGAQELASIIAKFIHPGNAGNIRQQKNTLTTFTETDECNWYKEGALIEGETKCTLTISETGNYKASAKVYKNQDSRIVSEINVTELNVNEIEPVLESSNSSLPPDIGSSSSTEAKNTSSTEAKIDSETDALKSDIAINANVVVQGTDILVTGYNGKISVFDINGNLVKTANCSASTQIPLHRYGVFIVKTDSKIFRIRL